MKTLTTKLVDVLVIEPDFYGDHRGWFMESYNQDKYRNVGIIEDFIQDNHSFSAEIFTLRGMHFQTGKAAQTKLIRCVRGKIWDVVVDLRKNSQTYKMWFGIELDAISKKQLYVPKGFAHGFLTLEPNTEVEYKVDYLYSKEHDAGINYKDTDIAISWDQYLNGATPVLSSKDEANPFLAEIQVNFEI